MRKLVFGTAALVALGIAGPAFAADIPAPVYKAPVVAPILYSWTGFYVGGNVGYSWGSGKTDLTDASTSTVTEFRGIFPCGTPAQCGAGPLPAGLGANTAGVASGTAKMNGFLGGLQAGYNAQYNSIVFGVEADIQATGQRGSVTLIDLANAFPATASDKMPWFATFRGRIGITPSPTWLLYVTAGAALAEIDQDFGVGAAPVLFSSKTTRFGWVAGAGAEAAIGNTNWTVKAEYLHMDFGSMSTASAAGTVTTQFPNVPIGGFNVTVVTSNFAAINTRVTDEVFRVGLNYRFMATDAAIVRKY